MQIMQSMIEFVEKVLTPNTRKGYQTVSILNQGIHGCIRLNFVLRIYSYN